jgi:hypothetical protein
LNFYARVASHNFASMKRAFTILLIASFAAPLLAQDAVAIAAQREQEENLKRLTATIQDVQDAQSQQKERLNALAGEVDKLRTEIAKANNNAATQEAIKKLNEEILKVDNQRVSDNKKIYEALADLRKLIVERPSAPPPPKNFTMPSPSTNPGTHVGGGTSPVPARSQGNATEEGFEYVVQSGDRLDLIVKEYQKQGIKVSMKQVMEANPTVKWDRLRIGQKIFIPKPK